MAKDNAAVNAQRLQVIRDNNRPDELNIGVEKRDSEKEYRFLRKGKDLESRRARGKWTPTVEKPVEFHDLMLHERPKARGEKIRADLEELNKRNSGDTDEAGGLHQEPGIFGKQTTQFKRNRKSYLVQNNPLAK